MSPELLKTRKEAARLIGIQIRKGKALASKAENLSSGSDLTDLHGDYSSWNSYNKKLLETIFTDQRILTEYDKAATHTPPIKLYPNFYDRVEQQSGWIKSKVAELESLRQRLTLLAEPAPTTYAQQRALRPSGSKVFIVHGHDDGLKQAVARFLETLGLEVVILHEQPNQGKTIIEKLETHSSEVDIGYAVVLLTPDDVGKLASDKGATSPRARQNVILELGYFMGKLGRARVCALHSGGMELPTDYQGVLYIPLDESSGWKLKLANELKAAGFDIDLNKLK